MSTFAQWFKKQRREVGVSQEDIASAIGYSVASIRKVEQGLRLPSLAMAQLLASYFQVPESDQPTFIKQAHSGDAPFTAAGEAVGSEGRIPGCAVPNNLPASSLTRLIGREDAVDELSRLMLESSVRLLTLTGPPGIGKTSLSLEVARRLVDEEEVFKQGVFFVNLAPTREVLFVADTVAATLSLTEAGVSTSFESLMGHLRSRRMLLVLDNFEQVIEAGPQLAALLVSCPGIKALVTSRERLNVRGERLFQVPALELPDPAIPASPSAIAQYASVKLLVERVASVDPNFRLTAENAPAIARVCAHMEGLPLAIELVAARTRLFPIEEIVGRLDRKLSLLVGGPRDMSPRQQTLRNAIEWSYNLLGEHEQLLFARLAVFAGGCTYPAVEAVCNATGDLLIGVLEGLESLLNKSLLRREQRGEEWRFSMLETIREYALKKLEESGAASKTKERHVEYFLTLAEVSEPHLVGVEQKLWLDRLEREHDNVRAALAWAIEGNKLLLAAYLAGALGRFWDTHGHLHEGRYWLDAVLNKVSAGGEELPTELTVKLLVEAGALAAIQADYSRSILLYEDALGLLRQEDNPRERANVLYRLARLRNETGDISGAREATLESLGLYKMLDDRLGMAYTLNMLGTVNFYNGHEAAGIEFYNESLALYRQMEDKQGAANVLNNLGEIARLGGDYRRAAALYKESIEPCGELGDQIGIAITLNNLGYMALNLGDCAEARALFTEGLKMCQNLGSPRTTALALYGLAGVFGLEGRLGEAAQLFGTAQALTEKINTNYAPADRADFERQIASVRSRMGEVAWSAAWKLGYSMHFDDAVLHALSNAGTSYTAGSSVAL
ncbi:MAG: tetratricopeptide repeat protein [Chloroflexi bacterium]|nr:tetratricopeptide repeat protein [Chloroflexota bacterium]